ncbi:glutathione S-transferase family protein [Phanerochaete sordida]|uniref:Glutathione S-transferase family protein n=1 Tax=Phanerochaete sordida TaxID=48140 RepID=A0A9P3GF06_9APHY|nr:glutathione S-transferase family protein [Phanerochaete sordida]
MPERITLYTAKICPYAHRAEIALAVAGVPYTRYEIDLRNKPEWYLPKVNPVGKVPAIAYGGPDVPADQPSPESVKLNESLVLVEFIADLFPESGILPADPVLRAKARLFIDAVSTKFGPAQAAVLHNGADPEPLVQALEALQALLPEQGFAIGEFSAADIAIAPFLARAELNLENDLGGYPEGKGEGQRILSLIRSPRLARWQEYSKAVQSHPAVASTFDRDHVLQSFKKRFAELRAKKFTA